VAELVDAQVSEACPRERVEVRFFSSAPFFRDEGKGMRDESLRPFSFCMEFSEALTTHQDAFGIALPDERIARLCDYYALVQNHNALLHLVAPCSAEEFAVRHILESLTLLDHLPENTKLADVGAGAGLPSIPCLLVRDDLSATLIETKEKKTAFLNEAVERLELRGRASVVNRQFEEADIRDCQFVTARALDKFTERLPRLLKWAKRKKLLLFGGDSLTEAIENAGLTYKKNLTPLSEKRYLFSLQA
jgi:16S rRNA (guanine(527)-N(7))-methyltransferase RsmG